MNSKSKKTISLYYISVLTALFILGCSATQSQEVENNSNDTPQTVEQSNAEITAYTPTAEFTPTARPTKTETPSPTPTEVRKTDEEYQQMREELNNLNGILLLLESANGLKTNYLIDDGSYEINQLKKYIGIYLELACHGPELLADLKFEPFVLINESGSNLEINVRECEFTKEDLVKLEENGDMISLSLPVFNASISNQSLKLFPTVKSFPVFDINGERTIYSMNIDFVRAGGMILGINNYQNFLKELDTWYWKMLAYEPAEHFEYSSAVMKHNATSFGIPFNDKGNMIFSAVMIIPSEFLSVSSVDRYILKGTVAGSTLFSYKSVFSTKSFEGE